MTTNEIKTAEFNAPAAPQLFEKRTIVELTDSDLTDVQGGTTPACAAAAASAAGVWVTIQIAKAGYQFGQWLAS